MTRRVAVSMLAAVTVSVLASVQPAVAARRVVTVATPGIVQGQPLRLAGDQVVFAAHTPFKPFVIDALPANGPVRQLAQVASASGGGTDVGDISGLALAASPSALAYSISRGTQFRAAVPEFVSAELFDGPLAGPYGRVDSCVAPSNTIVSYPVAVSGSLVARASEPCGSSAPGAATLIVDDIAPGAATPRRTLALPAAADQVAVAGNFAAAKFALPSGREQISVFDLGTQSESYHVVDSAGQTFQDFALQADGKVLAVLGAGPTVSCSKLAWFSPADPTAHMLPETCAVGEARLVGDRAAYFSAASGASELVTSALDGSARRTPLRITLRRPGTHVVVPFDFDGQHAAWALRSCPGKTMVAVDDFSDPNPFTAGPCGPPSVPRQAPRLSHGRLAVRLRCPGGCSGAVLLSTSAQGANLAVKRFATTSSHPVVKLRVPAGVARQIRRRGHLRVRIDVSLIELDALTAQRTPGRSLVVSG